MTNRVLGVDGYTAGWIGIVLSTGEPCSVVYAEIGELVARAGADGPIDAVAIDIPIGLADSGQRQADLLARKAAGPRSASVFVTPVREALLAVSCGVQVRYYIRVHQSAAGCRPSTCPALFRGRPPRPSVPGWPQSRRQVRLCTGLQAAASALCAVVAHGV